MTPTTAIANRARMVRNV